MKDYKNIIIGGGASGIALAMNLKKRNVPFLLIEKNDTLGSTWTQMPDKLCLISSDHHNRILEENSPHPKLKRVPAKDFAQYLNDFSKDLQKHIKLETELKDITKKDDLWILETTKGEKLNTKNLIFCTGYFNHPIIPSFVKDDAHTIHFKDFKNANALRAKKVLIVGKRLSAGQVIDELVQANIETHLSHRSKIEFTPNQFIFSLLLRIVDGLEKLILFFLPNSKNKPDVKMEASVAKKYFDQKRITLHTDIKEINGNKVTFVDESTDHFDKIILTTGFKPTLIDKIKGTNFSKLVNNFEHPEFQGLYFLGFEEQTNFRSRFLRGIRQDAKKLANLLSPSN